MEPKRESESDLLGDLAEESSIRYLLYLKHIAAQGRSRKEVKIGIGFGSPFGTLM